MVMLSLLCVNLYGFIDKKGNKSYSVIDFVLSLEPLLKLSIMACQIFELYAYPFVTREKLSMAKGKPQQTGMTAEINSIPTCAI
jgi:hypothetical protein